MHPGPGNVHVHVYLAGRRVEPGEGGRIIAIGAGVQTRVGFPGLADYTATKSAIVGYTNGTARLNVNGGYGA